MTTARTCCLLLAPCLCAALNCDGQTAPTSDSTQSTVAFTASLRTRIFAWDWFTPASGDNNYGYSGSIFRAGVSRSGNGRSWNAEFAVPVLLGLPSNAIGSGPQQGALGFGRNYFIANGGSRNSAMIFPKQLYLRFEQLGGNPAHKLQIGRFEFLDGGEVSPNNATLAVVRRDRVNARLIGTFGFTDVGRSTDGVLYSYGRNRDTFAFVAAVPTRGVFQTDGWGWNKVAFGYGSYTHEWSRGRHSADTRVFAIEYEDWRGTMKADNRPLAARQIDLANIRIGTLGGHTAHVFSTTKGSFDLLFWGAVQTGRWGVQRHRAAAVDIEGGVQPNFLPKLKPWLRAGYYRGSGDGNPNDNTHGTFFQILPTPRPFARFPFFNMMNNEDNFGTLSVTPAARVTASAEVHSLRLSNANDLWYSGGGVFQPWTFGYTGRAASGRKALASLYDLSVDYQVNPHFALSGYVGFTQGLSAMTAIYPKGDTAQLGYLEALIRF